MSDKKETILTDRLPEKNIVNNESKVVVGSEVSNLAPVVESWISVVNNYRPKPTSASRDASHIRHGRRGDEVQSLPISSNKRIVVAEGGIEPPAKNKYQLNSITKLNHTLLNGKCGTTALCLVPPAPVTGSEEKIMSKSCFNKGNRSGGRNRTSPQHLATARNI